ncbi:Fc.00g084660.m01.CDS01 [Cosmosporella sp. VM-42]
MRHPDCEPCKQPHFLDRELADWQIFEDIQPLFASSSVEWRLQSRKSRNEATVHTEALGIKSQNNFEFFRAELLRLPDTAPERNLSCEVFDNCCDLLSDLLELLEGLVDDRVLQASNALHEVDGAKALKNDDTTDETIAPEVRVPVPEGFLKSIDSILSWRYLLPFYAATNPPPELCVPAPFPTSTSTPSENPHTKETQRYLKLQALGKVVAAVENRNDITRSCEVYLQLEHTAEAYNYGLNILNNFNLCLESHDVSDGYEHTEPFKSPLRIRTTRWKDLEPSKCAHRLFNILGNKFSNCLQSQSKRHLAMLRLNGFQLEELKEEHLMFNMFLHPCRRSNYWRQSQFKPRTILQYSDQRPRFIHNLCAHLDHPLWEDSGVLTIIFDEKQLSAIPTDRLAHSDVLPEISLQDLLQQGLFQGLGLGFNDGDKAVLTLSLARCLLHLFQGRWMERPWTAESVKFLCRDAATDNAMVLDIHHPYVLVPLPWPNDMAVQKEPELSQIRMIMMSFARILLEIEIGETISVDTTSAANADDARAALFDILEHQFPPGYPTRPYHEAIRGCLGFKNLFAKVQRSDPKAKLDYQLRQVIYTTVITHLEHNLSSVRHYDRFMAVRNLRIKDGFIGKDEKLQLVKSILPESLETEQESSPPSPHQLNGVQIPEQLSFGLSDDNDGKSVTMFDGERSAPDHEHVTRAEQFLSGLDEFYQLHIEPKIAAGEQTGPRVRIAILDTGVAEDDDYIKARIDDIKQRRREKRREEVEKKREEGNTGTTGFSPPLKAFSPIRIVKSFAAPGDTGTDNCGHGTHVAGLLLRIAPDADIYVAKVACDIQFDGTSSIATAIDWAVAENVDIISMSFGLPSYDADIATAINKATAANKIMFAAASNGGKNQARTYPATSTNVIAVHAMSGNGEKGSINPPAKDHHDRLGTLGLGLKLRWKNQVEYKNGTSYATPVAAGIAANLIQWINCVAKNPTYGIKKETHKKWVSPYGVRNILTELMSQGEDHELLYVAPWHLWKQGRTEGTDRDIIGKLNLADGL